MDHETFISSLPAEQSIRLSERTNRAGLINLAVHFGLIVVFGTLLAAKVAYWWMLLPVQGVLLCFLFTLEHETTHKTPFANQTLNEWVGRLIGLAIFLPFQWFRYFHLAHHRYTNIPDKDPELLAGAKPDSWPAYVWYVSGLPYWIAMVRQLLLNATGRTQVAYLPPRTLPRIRAEARWMLLVYALVIISLSTSSLLLRVWLLPLMIGQPFLRLYLLAEHGRCAFVTNVFENTRTVFSNRIVRFFSWNMPYHVEHHLQPNVPFHRLPDLHDLVQSHLLITENGYTEFTRKYVAGLSTGNTHHDTG